METPRELFQKLMIHQPGGGMPARIFNWHWTFGMYGGGAAHQGGRHARAHGLRIDRGKSDDGITMSLDRMLAAIVEETLLVPISHVLFKSGFLQNAKAITERAHEVGATVVLDTYQSAGTVPFSVKEVNVDFATGGSVKWLCGGPGAGYLYVRPDLIDQLEPKTTGWMAHEHPFAFETDMHYAPNVTRFLHGGSHAIQVATATKNGGNRDGNQYETLQGAIGALAG